MKVNKTFFSSIDSEKLPVKKKQPRRFVPALQRNTMKQKANHNVGTKKILDSKNSEGYKSKIPYPKTYDISLKVAYDEFSYYSKKMELLRKELWDNVATLAQTKFVGKMGHGVSFFSKYKLVQCEKLDAGGLCLGFEVDDYYINFALDHDRGLSIAKGSKLFECITKNSFYRGCRARTKFPMIDSDNVKNEATGQVFYDQHIYNVVENDIAKSLGYTTKTGIKELIKEFSILLGLFMESIKETIKLECGPCGSCKSCCFWDYLPLYESFIKFVNSVEFENIPVE